MGCLAWPNTEIEEIRARLYVPGRIRIRGRTKYRRPLRLYDWPQMSIGHRSDDTSIDNAAPGATLVLTKPTGTIATDVLIAMLGSFNGSSVGTWTAPSGWTAISAHISTGGSADLAGFVALGNVASTTFTKSGTVGDVGATVTAFTGVDNVTPIDATGATGETTSVATLTTNAVTIATANAWHCIGCVDINGGAFTATGFTALHNNTTPPANMDAWLLYNTTPKATGSTGTVDITSSASASGQGIAAMPFALRPSAAAVFPGEEEGSSTVTVLLW